MARSYDLTSGSIPQHLLCLAAPLIMGNILQQLYNTVDAFILGRFAGDLEFAAVGVAGERERFRREHWLSLSCGLLVTLACSGLGFCSSRRCCGSSRRQASSRPLSRCI